MAINLDREVLRAEVNADPAGLGYAGMTDEQAAGALNRERQIDTEQVAVSYAELLDRAAETGTVRAAVEAIFAAQNTKASARQFVERMRYVGSLGTAQGTGGYNILQALVADGVLAGAQALVFVAWGARLVYGVRAHELWGTDTIITAEDVAEARAL